MDLQPNKIDGIIKPITNKRISASEWNQLVGSCMAFITAAGFTPDADDNQQFLNAFIQIAQNIGAVGANVDLSNLSATGENHFVQLQSGVAQADVDYVVESYQNGTSWYRVYKSGWCEQGGQVSTGSAAWLRVKFLKPFTNKNYNIQASYLTTTGTFVNSSIGIIKYANTYADISVYGAGFDASWRACGYIS